VADGAIAATAAERYIEEWNDFQTEVVACNQPVLLAFWNPEIRGSLEAVSKGADLCREHGWKLMEQDVSRRQFLARRYQVNLSDETPCVMLQVERGEVVQRI
jgi:thioredoxin reductase (NADPH)